MQLVFATSNEGKVKEAQAILGFPLEIVKIELDEIQHADITEIVRKKAEAAYQLVKKPVIVDDVGFAVSVWNGFPGPFIKFVLQNNSPKLLLYLMRNETEREITAISAIGFCDGEKTEAFIGEMQGVLATEERGTDGWGFDTVFIPKGYTQTIAELGNEMKNTLSHRKASLEKVKNYLSSYSQSKN